MKKKYLAPQLTSPMMVAEHSLLLNTSNVQGDGNQLSDRKEDFWHDEPEDGASFKWEEYPACLHR